MAIDLKEAVSVRFSWASIAFKSILDIYIHSAMSTEREYDVILLGATGYTGKLTAQYIFKSLPLDLKWAIAGRNKQKLQEVAESLGPLHLSRQAVGRLWTPAFHPSLQCLISCLDTLVVSLNEKELDSLAKRTRLVISTVGPFQLYGSDTFAACARNSTHYLDW